MAPTVHSEAPFARQGRRLRFAAEPYLSAPSVHRTRAEYDIEIAERAYPPDLADLKRDWVSSVAAPAFAILARRRLPEQRRRFCTIGTGSGVDALAAVEILGAQRIAITDLFEDVVAIAAANIRANLAEGAAVEISAGVGDLLTGLPAEAGPFDIVYENLPNLPVAEASAIAIGRTSGAHLAPRSETVPDFVARQHLTLHWLALAAALPWLADDGLVLSTIGSRVPLATLVDMARSAGYAARMLTYGWKLQSDADELIPTHAAHEAEGFGPFRFYPAEVLRAAFDGADPEAAGMRAFEIEAALASSGLNAAQALDAHRRGVLVGHTYVVLASQAGRSR
jgi:hypothetical protein